MGDRFDEFIGREMARRTWTWTSDEALLYAVGVGAGLEDPLEELAFTTENTEGLAQQVIPSFMTRAGMWKALWMRPLGFREKEWNGIAWGWPDGMVHGDQGVRLTRPLPPEGEADVRLIMKGVYDKGSGALVVVDNEVRLSGSEEIIGWARSGFFVRGQGGFGGPRGPDDEPAWARPEREPDVTVIQASSPGQSLIYRLCGDRNPHCTDPVRAREDGFPRPIFQGLGTYGFGCRALMKGLCDGDPARFGAMHARFAQPMFPGDVLTTSIWRTDEGAQFRTLAQDGRVVLENGVFSFAG